MSPEIDACRYLYLRRLWEPHHNSLAIIIDEGITDSGPNLDLSAAPVTQAVPIAVGPNSRAFELKWSRYFAYSIRNEGFAILTDSDIRASGRLLVVYETSNYLEFLRKTTWDTTDVFGPLMHVGVLCLNHIIDVVGFGPPEIRTVAPPTHSNSR